MLPAGDTEAVETEEGVDIDSVKGVLQAEHEQVQNRTFTNWVNAQLAKHKTPSVVQDLFQDLRDGHRILDLLEVLSGQRMERERGHSDPAHCRCNIETALKFLRKNSIKLVNVNVPDIVEGKPSIILSLIWSIILHFHIEKLASQFQSASGQIHVEPSPGVNSTPTVPPPRKRRASRAKWKMSTKKALLQWVQERSTKLDVNVQNFSTSWRSGLAFVAIINALRPGLLDPQEFKYKSNRENLERVFKVAEQELKIPRLLEAEDVDVCNPDEKSIITYVSQFLQHSKEQLVPRDQPDIHTQPHCLVGSEALGTRVSENDLKKDFEESRRRINACIEGAELFLKDRGSPEELITKHQETIKSFNSSILEHFLDATDKIKTVLTPRRIRSVEEMREQLCQNWEVVHSAVNSQLLQLKFEMEHNKFTEVLQECEKQLAIDSSPPQSRPAGHQVFFCEDSSLMRTNQHLAAMRQLCENMSGDRGDAEIRKAKLQACERRKTELEERAHERLSGLHDSVGSPLTGELKTDCPSGTDQGEAGTRQRPTQQLASETEWHESLGSEDSAQSVTKASAASTETRAAEPNSNILTNTPPGEIPGQSREWIGIRIQEPERDGQTQSAPKETPTRKLQSDWLEREDRRQPVTHCLIGEEPLSAGLGECSGSMSSVFQRGEGIAPNLPREGFVELLTQSLTVGERDTDQARGTYAQLVGVSSRGQGVALATKDSSQWAKGLLTGEHEGDRSPIVNITHMREEPPGGQGQGDITPRVGSALLGSVFPSEQHQGDLQTGEFSTQLQKERTGWKVQVITQTKEAPAQMVVTLSDQQQAVYPTTECIDQLSKGVLSEELSLTGKAQGEDLTVHQKGSLSVDEQADWPIGQELLRLSETMQGQSGQTYSRESVSGGDRGEDLTLFEGESLIEAKQNSTQMMQGSLACATLKLTELGPGRDPTGSQERGRETKDIPHSEEELPTDQRQVLGPPRVDSIEITAIPLTEAEQTGRQNKQTSDPLAAGTGKPLDQGSVRADSELLGEQFLSDTAQLDGLVRKHSAGSDEKSVSSDLQDDNSLGLDSVQLVRVTQDKSEQSKITASLTCGEQGEGSQIARERTNTRTMEHSVIWERERLREEEQAGGAWREECAASERGLAEREQSHGPCREDSEQLPISEQSQTHTEERVKTLQFLRGQGPDYGLPRQAVHQLVRASQSEQHQPPTKEILAQYTPECVCEQEPRGRAETESIVQLAKDHLIGIDQTQLGKSSPVGDGEFDHQTMENSGQLPGQVLNGDIQVWGLPGRDSEQLIPECLGGQDADTDLTTEESVQSGRKHLMGKELKGLERRDISQVRKELQTGKGQALGLLGLDSTETVLREREQDRSTSTGSTVRLVTVSLSGQIQDQGLTMEDSAALARESLSGRDQAGGRVREGSVASVKESLSGEGQSESPIIQDSVLLTITTQGQPDETETRESLTGGKQGEDLSQSEEDSLIGAEQTDTQTMEDSGNRGTAKSEQEQAGREECAASERGLAEREQSHGPCREDSEQLPISEQSQTHTEERVNKLQFLRGQGPDYGLPRQAVHQLVGASQSEQHQPPTQGTFAQYTPECVCEQEPRGRAETESIVQLAEDYLIGIDQTDSGPVRESQKLSAVSVSERELTEGQTRRDLTQLEKSSPVGDGEFDRQTMENSGQLPRQVLSGDIQVWGLPGGDSEELIPESLGCQEADTDLTTEEFVRSGRKHLMGKELKGLEIGDISQVQKVLQTGKGQLGLLGLDSTETVLREREQDRSTSTGSTVRLVTVSLSGQIQDQGLTMEDSAALARESLSGRGQAGGRVREGSAASVKESLSGEGQSESPIVQDSVLLTITTQGQPDETETRESLTGGKQGEDLSQSEEDSLIGAEQTDTQTMEDSRNWETAKSEQEQAGREECAASERGLAEREQSHGPCREDSEQLPISEQSQTHTEERVKTLQFLRGQGPDYGLPRQAVHQLVGASQSEQHQPPTQGTFAQYTPECVCEQEPRGRAETESIVQLAEDYLIGINQTESGPMGESQKLSAASVSERELTEGQTRRDLPQLGKSSPVGDGEFDRQTMENFGQLPRQVLSGDIQVWGLPGGDSEELIPESLRCQEADTDLTTEEFVRSGRKHLMGKELKGLEREDISQLGNELQTGKGQLGLLGLDSTETVLREREQDRSTSTGSTVRLVTVSLSGQIQDQGPTMADSAALARESLSGRDQAGGRVREGSAGSVKESLSGEGQSESPIVQDSVLLTITTQGQPDETETRESLTGGKQGEDLSQSEEDSLIGAEQIDSQRMEDSGNRKYGLPRQALPQLGVSQSEQYQLLTGAFSAPYTSESVSEQEQTGRAVTEKTQHSSLCLSEQQPLHSEVSLHGPERFVEPQSGKYTQLVEKALVWEEDASLPLAESARVLQLEEDQAGELERDNFPHRMSLSLSAKQTGHSAQSTSFSPNVEERVKADPAATLGRQLPGDYLTQEGADPAGKESVTIKACSIVDSSQPLIESLDGSNLPGNQAREDSSAWSTEQEFAGFVNLGLVHLSERGQQDKETREGEDPNTAESEEQEDSIDTVNDVSESRNSLLVAFAALGTVEERITSVHNSLLQFQNKPKILTGLSLKHESDLQMLKNLQTQIKSQIETCEELQSRESEASVTLDSGDHRAVCAVALGHTRRCQEIGLQAQAAEEALRALDGFLQLMRAVEQRGDSVLEQEGAVQAGTVSLEKEEETRPLWDRALDLDKTLAAAQVYLMDGSSGERTCCRDLALSLGYNPEGVGLGLEGQESVTQEELHKAFCTKQNRLIGCLQEIETRAGEVGLGEATLPGVQQRLRSLNDLNTGLQSKATDLSELRDLTEQLAGVSSILREEAQERLHATENMWEETERNIHDWQDQCCVLVAFLREFQNYKKELASTIQKGEDVIPASSSYMDKEKLQRLMRNIDEVKLEFSDRQEEVDELRKICCHLQSELRKIMDNESLPFQGEADELLDEWLDVSERLDTYSTSLKHALSLWQDLSESGPQLEEWLKRWLETPRESVTGQENVLLEEELQILEQQVQSFHEKAARVQELLEWEEVPLELQVVESTVRKKMDQIKHTHKQLSARGEELSGAPDQLWTKLEPMEASGSRPGQEQNPQFHHDPQAPCMEPEQSQEPHSDRQHPEDTDSRRRRNETLEEESAVKRRRESQLVQMEDDQSKNSAAKYLRVPLETGQERVQGYPEEVREYVTKCRQLSDSLNTLETALKNSTAQTPNSYKAAIQQVEKQAALGREISLMEVKMLELRNRAKDLERAGEAGSERSASQSLSTLWDHWLCLQDSVREQELHSRSLREEWKSISEQIDRVVIDLDHLQDDLPEGPREQATEAELQELEEFLSHYHGNLKNQQSALAALLCRVTRLLGVQEPLDSTSAIPVLQELRAMEDRCRSLERKIQKSRREIEKEGRERDKPLRETNSIGDWLQQVTSQSENTELDNDGAPETGLEQFQDTVNAQREAMMEISGHLQNKYSEPHISVPTQTNSQILESSRALGDMEAKLQALGSQNTQSQELRLRIGTVGSGLQSVEKMLQECSKTHSEAKAQQKRIWRGIDDWHSVLSQLDAEVQDLAELDPRQAQELMESLLDPFQQHQHVSRIAEQRTALLNKIPECLEEYKQLTDSAVSWNESSGALLSSKTDYTSAKTLRKQLLAFQVMAEGGRQKENSLQDVASRLKELSVMYQTDEMMQCLSELRDAVSTLQQAIDQKLTQIEHVATEVGDIEIEAKLIENKLSKINAILSSIDLYDLSILEHLENRQIILENLEEMKDLVGVMAECKESLGLSEEVICTVEVFTKLKRVNAELKHLQEMTTQQNAMLQLLLEKLQECDAEMERLQQGGGCPLEAQGERLSTLMERRNSLLNDAQEALTQLVQEELSGEQPVAEGGGEEELSLTVHTDQARDSQVMPIGKLPSLMEEDEDEEDENTAESVKRSQSPEPARHSLPLSLEDLNVCRDQATTLERWLDGAQESLGVSGGDQEMQQGMEEQLIQSQRMLLEIEQKVSELGQASQEGGGTLQPELELLSLRLGMLKSSLVTFQAKLQDIQSEDQGPHDKGITPADGTSCLPLPTGQPALPTIKAKLSRQDSLQHQKELEVELSECKQLTEYISLHGDKMNQQIQRPQQQEATQLIPRDDRATLGDAIPAEPPVLTEVPTNSNQVATTWQHLQRETEGRRRLLEDSLRQGLGLQVSVTAGGLHRVHGTKSTSPLAEQELNMWLSKLQELAQQTITTPMRGEGHINQDERLKLEKSLQDALLGISHWLDTLEEGIPSSSSAPIEEAEEQLQCQQRLAATLERLQQELSEQRCVLGQGDVPAGIFPQATGYLASLQSRLKQLQAVHSTVRQSLRDGVSQIRQYQGRLRQFEAALLEMRTDVRKQLLESVSQSKDEQLQLMEKMEDGLDSLSEQWLALVSEGEQYDLEHTSTLGISPLEELLDGTRVYLKEQQRQFQYSVLLDTQYQCLVQGLVDLLNSGQAKVTQEAKPPTNSIGDFQSHLQSYKLFFRRLGNHLILVEQFSRNLPELIVTRSRDPWLKLVEEATALQSQALLRGVQMETALQAWAEFEMDHSFLMKEMEKLNSTVPSIGLVEETEERLAERVGTFQRIRGSLNGNQARVDQALRKGKALLNIVNSSELENQLGTLEESWLSFCNQVNRELHRLELLLQHRKRFQRESHELGQWLESARGRLRHWEQESVSLPSQMEISRNQLQLFLEFWKEVDGMSALKMAAISTGSQLLQLKQTQGGVLRSCLTQLEQEWAQVATQLPGIQEKLHQRQMDVLSSRQAITQLRAWISDVQASIQGDSSELQNLDSSIQVKLMLQKYKGYQMEVSCWQLTVDFVNQSVLQMSSQDVESDRGEKTDFAESLGALNFEWQSLTQELNRKMLDLGMLLESWTEYEHSVQSLSSWLDTQEERLRKNRKACSHTAVINALRDCQELGESLKVREMELERLRHSVPLVTETTVPKTPSNVTEKLGQLTDLWRNLDSQVNQLESVLTSRLQLWAEYQDSYEQVNGNILRAQYCLEHCTPLSSSLESVCVQVERLQALQDTMECGEERWRKFQENSQRLSQECCPPLAQELDKKCEDTHSRWVQVNQDITEQLHSAHTVSQLWRQFRDAYQCTLAKVQCSEDKCKHLLTGIWVEQSTQEKLQTQLAEAQDLLSELRTLQEDLSQVCEARDALARQIDGSSCDVLQSDSGYLSGKVSYLETSLAMKIPEIQDLMDQHEDFHRCLHSLETLVNESEEVLKSDDLSTEKVQHLEIVKDHLLRLSNASLRLETLKHLSYRLPLSDQDYRRVQALNQRWEQARVAAQHRYSKLQAVALQGESFGQKCEQWSHFLERMEGELTVDVASSYKELKEQQETQELLQADVSIAHQILDAVDHDAQNLIPRGDIQESIFTLKFSALKQHWHGLVQKIQQHRDTIYTLANQWHYHSKSTATLRKLLTNISNQLQAMGDLNCYSLQQLWELLEDVKHKERDLQGHESRYVRTLEKGKELLSMADFPTETSLEDQLSQLQEAWESTNLQLKDKRIKLTNIKKMCDRCGKEVTELGLKLREFTEAMKKELPCSSEDLQREQTKFQELGESMRFWSKKLAELGRVKGDLRKHLVPDAAAGFQEQVAILESQWEQLHVTVSLRTLEISDRLKQWVVFNSKSKQLEDWLKQMGDRVSQNTDCGVEGMIERLQKDCMGDIKLYNRNKVQLEQLGEELIKASSTSKASEIDNKLHLINNHWQHLLEAIEARVKKLKGTLGSVQHLDKEMSSLRTWLSRIESELSKPVVYNICDDQEIEKKLAEQQELQRDIEQHSVGVTSVLSLCDSLLLDTDTETECDSIQQTTRSLDHRWRNICAMSVERRMKIEETWRLWQKFLDDYSRFEDWLNGAERTAAQPNSSQVLYSLAKEELKRFETFQRQIHESLTQLELINKQYRRLARENRTDSSSRLKQMVHEGNQRWDSLQKRIAAILRRLKYFTNQREEFESCREGILVWLTEMDLQLTNVEHFSESDIDDKVRQLNAFQQEITLNTNKIDQLIVCGEMLIQKIEPMDAITIEEELEELHAYCQEVFGRVARFHQRLMSKQPMLDEDKDLSDREADTEDGSELQSISWQEKAGGPELPAEESLCHLALPGEAQQHERSGGVTPVSVDSIPLEWDHTVDVGGSSSHEDEDDGLYFSTLSDVQITESPEAYVKMTEITLRTSAGDVGADPVSWRLATSPDTKRKCQFQQTEITIGHHPPTEGQRSDTAQHDSYVKLLSECSGSINSMRREADILRDEVSQQAECLKLPHSDHAAAGIERWDLFHAQALSEELLIKQNLQQWQQLNSDLDDISAWLSRIEPTLNQPLELEPSTGLRTIEENLRSLQGIQKELDKYKALVISANLSSREFLQTDSVEAQELQQKLHQVNGNWNKAAQRLEHWRTSLQTTLIHNQDFQHTTHSLLMWLANCERRCGLVQLSKPGLSLQTLTQHHKELMSLEAEMLEKQPQVNQLQLISRQLLESGEGAECAESKEKVHVIGNKLKLLLGETAASLQTVNERLDTDSMISVDELEFSTVPRCSTPLRQLVGQGEVKMDKASGFNLKSVGEVGVRGVSKAPSFLARVLWAAFPLQLLILLLLLLACLIPFSQEDYNCALANNFARSLYPMLRYTNGPPPT
ncbi:nesprin-2-like isoform X3 [Mustelus asterias]